MRESQYVSIDFYLENKLYAMRNWSGVPAIGQEVALRDPDRSKNDQDLFAFKVIRVIWGFETERDPLGATRVRISVERVPEPG